MAAEWNELLKSTKTGESKSDEEFVKVGTELSKRMFERRPVIFHLDTGSFFKESKEIQRKEISGDVAVEHLETLFAESGQPDKAKPMVDLLDELDLKEVSLNTPLASLTELVNSPNTIGQKSGCRHEFISRLTGPGLVNFTGTETGLTLDKLTLSASTTDFTEEAFLHNEDLSEEDRNKAIAWAAAAQGVEHVGFLPECVLKTGFKIKKFKLWMPLEICVDYQYKRLTMMCPDTFSDVLLRKIIAHRIEVGDVRVETPVSHKHKTDQSSSSSGVIDNMSRFSKRRLNMIRTDGHGKYRLIAPTTEYRNRFLDILFMMNGPPLDYLKAD